MDRRGPKFAKHQNLNAVTRLLLVFTIVPSNLFFNTVKISGRCGSQERLQKCTPGLDSYHIVCIWRSLREDCVCLPQFLGTGSHLESSTNCETPDANTAYLVAVDLDH